VDLPTAQRRLAKRIRALRKAKGLSQEDMEDFGLTSRGLQKLEYGLSDPKLSSLLKISRALGVGLGELLDLEQ